MRIFNKPFLVVAGLISIQLVSCKNFSAKQTWHKGNLHTHSLWSDGDDFPEMIIQWYKDNDYQFIALSDHNTIGDSEFWYEIREREVKNKTLEKYQNRFGDWVETKMDSGKTLVRLKTFEEFRSKLQVPDSFLVIKSEEVTSSFEKKPIHINVTNIVEKIDPIRGTSVLDVMQRTLDSVHEQRKRLKTPMFAHINHPNFGYGISADDLKQLNGERFFEVYNGHPAVNNEGDDMHIDTETMWDLVNIHYLNEGKPLLFGIATDDSHRYHSFSSEDSNSGRGWVMVNCKKLATEDIISAMEKGDFYASTGVHLKKLFTDKKQIEIEVDPEFGVIYEIIFIGYQKEAEDVVELKKVIGKSASYTFQKEDVFVRVRINSDAKKDNPIIKDETKKAWTQPLLVE
ncbi:MAG: histidinol-phosphatase [Flavobacteriaceae bacterium]|nr:histidinol-phosphatase [Flavobacteriaceae bacterium]